MAVVIGLKYRGKAFHKDTQAGTYFEVLPVLSLDDERIQHALLNQNKKKKVQKPDQEKATVEQEVPHV